MTAEQVLAEMDSPSFVPTVKVGKVLHEGDSIQYMEMNNVYVYPQLTFKNKKQAQAYMRLVTNVKKVLPIAKEAKQLLYETTEVLDRAGFWQVFAWSFGASLKKGYDAEGVDRLTERVVLMVESGQI